MGNIESGYCPKFQEISRKSTGVNLQGDSPYFKHCTAILWSIWPSVSGQLVLHAQAIFENCFGSDGSGSSRPQNVGAGSMNPMPGLFGVPGLGTLEANS